MNTGQITEQCIAFMEATESEIIEKFSSLPDAQQLPYEKNRPIIFVPGTRKDRVLLVAHYDTVWWKNKSLKTPDGELPIKVQQSGFMLHSATAGRGIGADNRLGCLLLWTARKLGHSLLLVPDEEIGCKGSGVMATNHADLLQNHNFMMQFDRRNNYDLVYYGFPNDGMDAFLKCNYPGFSKSSGSCTDIVRLIPAAGCHGVNVSVGFRREHNHDEHVDLLDYIRTGRYTLDLLSQTDLPEFKYTPVVKKYKAVTGAAAKAVADKAKRDATTKRAVQGSDFHRQMRTWETTRITSWKKTNSTPSTVVTPSSSQTSTPASTPDLAVCKRSTGMVLDGNEVDGYDARAEYGGGQMVTIINPAGESRTLTISQNVAHTLKTNDLRNVRAIIGDILDAPCSCCRVTIPPDLQIHCLKGEIICAICSHKLYDPPESIKQCCLQANNEMLVAAGLR